jgi:hypothetical protein
MGVAHYLPYGEQAVMGSWRRAERLIRCEINRFSLRRGRSALHNIGGPPPYGTPNGKTQTVDFAVLSHLGRGYFRPTRQRIASLWPIRNGEHVRAGSLPGRDGAFASSPLPIAPHKAGVVSDTQVRAGFAAFDMAAQRRRSAALDRRHDLQLAEAHMAGMGRTPSRPAVAEDVRHLDRRP